MTEATPAQTTDGTPAPDAPEASATTPEGGQGTATTDTSSTSTDGKAPEWNGDFDPTRAAALVANLRNEIATLKAKAPKAPAKSTSTSSSTDDLAALRQEIAELRSANEARDSKDHAALITSAATKHSIPDDLRPFLTGKTAEELETQAALIASNLKRPGDHVPGKPRPVLTPGHGGEDEAPFDPSAVVKAIRRR